MSRLLVWLAGLCVLACVTASPVQTFAEDENRQGVLLSSPVCARLEEYPRRFKRQSLDHYRNCQCVDSMCAICTPSVAFLSPEPGSPAALQQQEQSSNLPERIYARSLALTCEWSDTKHRACNYSQDPLDGPSCDCSEDGSDVAPLELFTTVDHQCPFSPLEQLLEIEENSGFGEGSGFGDLLLDGNREFSGNEPEASGASGAGLDESSGSVEDLTEELF